MNPKFDDPGQLIYPIQEARDWLCVCHFCNYTVITESTLFDFGYSPWGWSCEKDWLFGQKVNERDSEKEGWEREKGTDQIKHVVIWEAKQWGNKDKKTKDYWPMTLNKDVKD